MDLEGTPINAIVEHLESEEAKEDDTLNIRTQDKPFYLFEYLDREKFNEMIDWMKSNDEAWHNLERVYQDAVDIDELDRLPFPPRYSQVFKKIMEYDSWIGLVRMPNYNPFNSPLWIQYYNMFHQTDIRIPTNDDSTDTEIQTRPSDVLDRDLISQDTLSLRAQMEYEARLDHSLHDGEEQENPENDNTKEAEEH